MRFLNRRRFNQSSSKGRARKDSLVKERIAARTNGLRRAAWRNRILLVALLAVGGLVALLNGIGSAGFWAQPASDSPGAQASIIAVPPARWGAASTFDQASRTLLIFGGFSGFAPDETVKSQVKSQCDQPFNNNVICGPLRNVLQQAGQKPIDPPKPVELGDTWTFNRAKPDNWWVNAHPIHTPSPRGFAAMAYDGARKNVVLFGGAPFIDSKPGAPGQLPTSLISGETWTWDGVDWTLRNPPEPRPPSRKNASMVYDAHRRVVIMFGGRTGTTQLSDTWAWDGVSWKHLGLGRRLLETALP